MRIAIIGSGIAGLTAAWRLRDSHDVTVFEAAHRAGGHTHTHHLSIDGQSVAVDTGFIVFNDRNYPNLERLFGDLGIRGTPSGMSFSVSCERTGIEYNGGSLAGLLARRRNLVTPDFWRMIRDIVRFNRDARALLSGEGLGPSLGEYLASSRYGRAFTERYLLPMGAAIWSVPTAQMMEFPARRLIEFFANHGLLDLRDRPQWFVVPGGSDRYVQVIADRLGASLRLARPVTRVRRLEAGVEIEVGRRNQDAAGNHAVHDHAALINEASDTETHRFDTVVFACHSDEALAVLADPTQAEREVLGAVGFQRNDVILHTDAAVMPRARAAWAAWNYRLPLVQGASGTTVTYWMNLLQHIATPTNLFVTLNQAEIIDPDKVLARTVYSHPVFDTAAVTAQGRRHEISGQRNTWYCGAWWRYGFHEDGCLSAEDVVREIEAHNR
jgi:hypothetical protein